MSIGIPLYMRLDISRLTITLAMFVVVMVATFDLASGSSEQPEGEDRIATEDWYIGPHFGISAYTGFIGLEIQQHNFAFTAGLPGHVGIKYYLKPYGHSLFAGGYFVKYSNSVTRTEGGAGGGFRWRWGTGWDLSLSVAAGYGEEKETIGSGELTTIYISIRPGITIGYSF